MIIVVLGMHRSGTSLASGLLAQAGVYFGEEKQFIRANQENPKGFWERRDVRKLNDKLLHSMNCDWSEVSSLAGRTPPLDVLAEFEAEAKRIIDELRDRADTGVIGLKEPRLCLLMPYWQKLLGDQVFHVLVYRDPAETAISLAHRNGIPHPVSHYLTEQYLGHAIAIADSGPHQIVRFRDLIERPASVIAEIAGALEALQVNLKSVDRTSLENFVEPTLYRSKANEISQPASATLKEWVKALDQNALPGDSDRFREPPSEVLHYEHDKRFEEFRKSKRAQYAAEEAFRSSSENQTYERYLKNHAEILRRRADEIQLQYLEQLAFELANECFEISNYLVESRKSLADAHRDLSVHQEFILEQERQIERNLTDIETLSEISGSFAQRIDGLFSSRSWKLNRPLLSFLLEPSGLGRHAGILTDMETVLEQHRSWVNGHRETMLAESVKPRAQRPFEYALAKEGISAEASPPRLRDSETLLRRLDGSLRVGLAVTEVEEKTGAGDLFTAQELASALKDELGWEIELLGRESGQRQWYQVGDLDCLVTLLQDYDLREIPQADGDIIKIAWIRNWVDRWVAKPWFAEFDLVLCSSESAAAYVREKTGKAAEVLRIGTNADRFHPRIESEKSLRSDYCFTGSYWGVPRDVEQLHPADMPYDFAVFGHGWDQHERFGACYRGSLPYDRMPEVYAGSKILIDDANFTTRPWASINSRVFDALACGTLVITNGRRGVKEIFGDKLPTFGSADELQSQLEHFLSHPKEREQLAGELREVVLQDHTYCHRALKLKELLAEHLKDRTNIGLRLSFNDESSAGKAHWMTFSNQLADALRSSGYRVDINLSSREQKNFAGADVVMTLAGNEVPDPVVDTINLLWILEPLEEPSSPVHKGYQHIFVASNWLAKGLRQSDCAPVQILLPCAIDWRDGDSATAKSRAGILHLGDPNAGLLSDAKDAGFEPVVLEYGQNTGGATGSGLSGPTQGQHLGKLLAASEIVLCAQNSEMSAQGFVPANALDALASGVIPLCLPVRNLSEALSHLLVIHDGDSASLGARLESLVKNPSHYLAGIQEELAAFIELNSFSAGAAVIDAVARQLLNAE